MAAFGVASRAQWLELLKVARERPQGLRPLMNLMASPSNECPPSTVDSAAGILPPGSCLVPAGESTKGHQRPSHEGMANLLQKRPQRSPQTWPGLQQRLYPWLPINESPLKTRKWFSTPVKITPLHTCFKHTPLSFYDTKPYDIKDHTSSWLPHCSCSQLPLC